MPDTTESKSGTFLNNHIMAAELAGVEVPDDAATRDQVLAYLTSIMTDLEKGIRSAGGSHLSGTDPYAETTLDTAHLRGFDVRDVTASAWIDGDQALTEIILGEFSPDEFDSGVRCEDCPEPITVSYEGESWFHWNEEVDLEMRLAAPVFDQVGRGGNWYVQEDLVARTLTDDDMEIVIDAKKGNAPSLAEFGPFTVLLEAMTELNAYSVYLTTDAKEKTAENYYRSGGYGFSPEQLVALQAKIDKLPALVAYSAMAIGSAIDDAGPYTAVALYHENPDDAIENAGRLVRVVAETTTILDEKPWSRIITGVETEAREQVTMAKLRRDGPPIGFEMIARGEAFFAHE